jgi:DNA-binding CsgD family transcriptional regulator
MPMQDEPIKNQQKEWQVKLLEQGLEQLGQAMIIVSSRVEVVYVSKAANAILTADRGVQVADGKLTANLGPDNRRLQEAIELIVAEGNPQHANINTYVHRNDYTRPIMLSISKMPKSELERRNGHHAMVLIKDLNLNQEHWLDRLKIEYGLAPRETECVSLVAEGRDISDVAEIMEIGKETVRQYMKSVYKKMKVHKQHELVSLALEYRRNR